MCERAQREGAGTYLAPTAYILFNCSRHLSLLTPRMGSKHKVKTSPLALSSRHSARRVAEHVGPA